MAALDDDEDDNEEENTRPKKRKNGDYMAETKWFALTLLPTPVRPSMKNTSTIHTHMQT